MLDVKEIFVSSFRFYEFLNLYIKSRFFINECNGKPSGLFPAARYGKTATFVDDKAILAHDRECHSTLAAEIENQSRLNKSAHVTFTCPRVSLNKRHLPQTHLLNT